MMEPDTKFGRRSVRDVLENPRNDEYYVLVTRYYPIEFRRRALKLQETSIDEWDRNLAPSPELLGWWRKGLRTPERWTEYTRRFLEEVPPVLIREEAELHSRRSQGKKVVFVCTEEDGEYPYCHTWLLLDVLKETIPKRKLETVVDYDRQYTLEELREKARQRGLSASGSKKELAAKLIARGVK